MLQYLFSPTKQFTYESGKLLDGGKIYVYIKDTTILATLYDVDEDYVSNPIILDANGRASVKADDTYEYRLEIYTNRDVLLYTCNAFCDGGDGEGSLSVVRHDETLSGNGTSQSLLGVINIPLAVDETMTAYTAEVDEKESLVLGVNGEWFNDTFGSALNTKVDWSAFSSCCSAVKGRLDNKLDISAFDLSNYYNKQEINNALDLKLDRSEFYNNISGFQTKLEFGYDENSAISSINNSALAGQGGDGNCPWISGTKVIADTQTLTSNMIIQVLSSFDLSGDHNHFIGMKGGTYRFPNEYEIGSALLHTDYFMHLSGMSAYLPLSSFSSYTASISNNLQSNWDYTTSAYNMSLNNFYNKLDISAFSAYSEGQNTTINNITEQITNISNASGDWNDISAYQQNSANYLTGVDLSNYYQKNETSSKSEIENALSSKLDTTAFTAWSSTFINEDYELSAGSGIALVDDTQNKITRIDFTGANGDEQVNQVVRQFSANGTWLTAHQSLTNYVTTSQLNTASSFLSGAIDYVSANGGKTYTGVAPIQVNNTNNQISITGESLSAGPNIDIFSSGGYVVISSNGGNAFPMTGTDGTANYTANANFSSFTLTTGQGAAGCYVNMDAKGVRFEAYPSTDVSASWYNIITHQDKITCSAVKLTTAANTYTFQTSALPNLNKITFIAPTYGPYQTYSALINDGETEFKAEVDSGCIITVVKAWNDNRNKDVWCGLGTANYEYIG